MCLLGRVNQSDPGRSSDCAVLSLAPGSEGQTGFTSISLPPMLLFCWPLFRDSPATSHQGVNRAGERSEAAEHLRQAERDTYKLTQFCTDQKMSK